MTKSRIHDDGTEFMLFNIMQTIVHANTPNEKAHDSPYYCKERQRHRTDLD